MPPLRIGMETALSMARLGAEVNACGGTPRKRASALPLLRRFLASQEAVLDDSSCESARLAHPEFDLCFAFGDGSAGPLLDPRATGQADWTQAKFAKLQALPKEGKAVTLWPDRDLAWTNVAEGIRRVAEEIRSKRSRA